MVTREQLEQREETDLASYAAKAGKTRGRKYPIQLHPLRTEYQRDRDRIIHSAAFRRLEYKTQVFIPHERDHNRTRLTHTIEVAQISRTLARVLQLNDDLAEAVALAHDLGHTPFGHAGEDALNIVLKSHGGYNHNRQSLRIVDLLEQRYPDYRGLNLTYEVREGLIKHETHGRIIPPEFHPEERTTIEASLVDVADEIAYNAHDIDDGLASGFLSVTDIKKSPFFASLQLVPANQESSWSDDLFRHELVRRLVDAMVRDVLGETNRRLKEYQITDFASVRNCQHRLCDYSPEMKEIVFSIKGFLSERLYRHPHLLQMSQRAEKIVTTLFAELLKQPERLPERFQAMLDDHKELVVADYIAGMTDRYAEKMYHTLTGRTV